MSVRENGHWDPLRKETDIFVGYNLVVDPLVFLSLRVYCEIAEDRLSPFQQIATQIRYFGYFQLTGRDGLNKVAHMTEVLTVIDYHPPPPPVLCKLESQSRLTRTSSADSATQSSVRQPPSETRRLWRTENMSICPKTL